MRRYNHLLRLAALASALAVSALISFPGFPQTAPSKNQAAPQTTSSPVRVSSRLVQVNVIVQDRDGQPVSGLTKTDFNLLDQGQPQSIAFFSEQTSRVNSKVPAGAAPPPDLFSNRLEERFGAPTSVTVVLLDALNTPRGQMAYARFQTKKFLGQIQPQDRVALYGLSDKIYILHDFTSDSIALLKSIGVLPKVDGDKGNSSAPMDYAFTTGISVVDLDGWSQQSVDRSADFNTVNRVGDTAKALETIANHLASLPGRKNLVWVSSSFPFQIGYGSIGGSGAVERRSFNSDIERAARALSNANVAIYPVDARGLMAPAVATGRLMNAAAPSQGTIDSMVALADRTGGRAFYNTNDINGAIRRAIDDARVTYVLSYYPTHNQWDGRFREIKVQVNRPGVQVRTRKGYFAFPEVRTTPKESEDLMVIAARAPLDSTELGMDVIADPIDVPGARQLKTQVSINTTQMHFEHAGDHWTDVLVVKWVQFASDGKVLASNSETLNINLPQSGYDELIRKGLNFSGNVGLVDKVTEIRLVVRDAGSGAIGSVSIPMGRVFGTPAK